MVVLDTSAILAVLLEERGAELVKPHMVGAQVSIISIGEVLARAAESGAEPEAVLAILDTYLFRVRAFRDGHAIAAAKLRPLTKHLGLGFGDRACLVQAQFSDLPVLTADHDWAKLNIGVEVRLIRERR
ncbi:type II toxin-antitoxin system VapC family toxin [uncultured Sphingomonas sp.]|uniref:type II toxin-antitoxin system VapC family toxin n=1 Tax=uncultured Sphingomonas sp. TaxID=158754 RepID=UPI0035CAA0E9